MNATAGKKEEGAISLVFERNVQPSEFIKTNNFDLAYISSRNERFETHSREDKSNHFESLNHEISEVIRQQYPCVSQYLIAKFSYYLTHCMIRDTDGGADPKNVIRQYFNGTLDRQQYAKIISVLQKPCKETSKIPIVSTIEGIKGQDGNNCLFILTTDLAPYLFGEKTTENKTKNKLYVALTRSLNRLTILVTLEVEAKYGAQYIQDCFAKLLSTE